MKYEICLSDMGKNTHTKLDVVYMAAKRSARYDSGI